MPAVRAQGLNDSGEDGLARIFNQGAFHHSRGQRTSRHSHYAWKLHIGLDAPVWVESEGCTIGKDDGARVVVVPPGVEHRTGAVGWSLAVFLSPGSRGTSWRASTGAIGLTRAAAARVVAMCDGFDVTERWATADFSDELASVASEYLGGRAGIDPRVELALTRLKHCPDVGLPALARSVGLSLDRLSRLTARETGLGLRRHVLWNRVVGFLSSGGQYETLAAAAAAAGFSDHAHMTRTCRQFLGRSPSEFKTPPETIGKW